MGSMTRRAFLAQGAAAAAAATVAGRLPHLRAETQASMFVSLNGSVARGVPWPDSARLASRLGYGGIDWNLGAARQAGAAATRALLAELTLQPTITGLPVNLRDPAVFARELPNLEEAASLTAAIGGTRMMVVLPTSTDTPKAEYRAMYKDHLIAVGEVLRRHNIRLGMEFLGPLYFRTRSLHPFIWTLRETVELGVECGPNIGAVLDAWHWHHSGGTVSDIEATDASRIVHIHVSDALAMPAEDVRDNMRKLPGEGIIDLTGFFQALRKIGYGGGVSPEPLGRFADGSVAEDTAKQALETAAAAMRRAKVI